MIYLICRTDGIVTNMERFEDLDEAEEWFSKRKADNFLVVLSRNNVKEIYKMQMTELEERVSHLEETADDLKDIVWGMK